MTKRTLVIFFLFNYVWCFAWCEDTEKLTHPYGFEQSCESMNPQGHGHPNDPKSVEDAPYSIELSDNHVYSGDNITIVLSGNTDEDTFSGFMVQARSIEGDHRMGTFHLLGEDNWYCCGAVLCDYADDTMAQKYISTILQNATFLWKTPADFQGSVTIFATIAKDADNYWVKIPSETIIVEESAWR